MLRRPGCARTFSKRPLGSSARSLTATRRSAGEPAGRGPASTCILAVAIARVPSKRLTLALGTVPAALAGGQWLVVMVGSAEEREAMDGQRDQPTEEHQLTDQRDDQQLDREPATAIAVLGAGTDGPVGRFGGVGRVGSHRTRRYRPDRAQSSSRAGGNALHTAGVPGVS